MIQQDSAALLHDNDNDINGNENINDGEVMSPEPIQYEKALEQIGVGFIQYCVLAVCGLGNAVDAVEILSISYILPQLLDQKIVSTSESVLISSSVFAGMLVGGLGFGAAADQIGRKKTYVITMGLNAICAALFAGMKTPILMMALRFLTGIGVGGAVPAVFTLALEVLPAKKRGFFLNYVPSFWVVGAVLIAVIAYGILPYFGWHVFALVCSVPPAFCAIVGFFWLPESPRFLLTRGRVAEAEAVVRKFAQWDGMKRREVSQVLTFSLLPITRSEFEESRTVKQQLTDLMGKDLRRTTILFMIVWFSISFGWYGMFMWMPDLLKERGIDDNNFSTIVINAASVPGNIFAALMLDRVGRRLFLSMTIGSAAVMALLFNRVDEKIAMIFFFSVFNATSTSGWNALGIMSVESFPTTCRTTATGLLGATGRVGAMVSQSSYLSGGFASVMINFVILMIGCVAAALQKKETSNAALDDMAMSSNSPAIVVVDNINTMHHQHGLDDEL